MARRLLNGPPMFDRDPKTYRTAALATVLAIVLLGGGTAVADALVQTDEERLDELVAVLHESEARVDRIASYTDAERVAVTLADRDGTDRLRDPSEVRTRLHEVLAPLDRDDAELLQVTRSVDGERGRLTLRVRSEGRVADIELTLRRDGQTFLVVGARRLG